MVRAASTFGRSGRTTSFASCFSAIVIALYALFMVSFLVSARRNLRRLESIYFEFWMKVFTMLVLTAVLIHGWIGIWQVLTDYVKNALAYELFIQFVFSVGLIVYWLTGLLYCEGV